LLKQQPTVPGNATVGGTLELQEQLQQRQLMPQNVDASGTLNADGATTTNGITNELLTQQLPNSYRETLQLVEH
jgi:hypothetical protein